jgi:hypothetical protein
MTDRELNRALLARQGLLERMDAPLTEVVESIGAMQGQAWAALVPGLWSRMASFSAADLYGALERGDLHWGIGIRGTLHLVSAREHPDYAAVAATDNWHRAIGETTDGMRELRAAVLNFAKREARTREEIREFSDAWVHDHPGAIDAREVEAQRSLKWRPVLRWSRLIRVPKDGKWGAKAPADHLAAPGADAGEGALERVARAHLRAFGPASAEDVAQWIGWRAPPVRELLDRLDDLVRIDALYDLPDAPLPDPDTPAPPRLLGAFDSTLLAYASGHRGRILPEGLRDVVYEKKNLQIKPAFLVDGLVAGIWSIEVRRREATLTLRPAKKLPAKVRKELTAEAERLARALHPDARAHRVEVV